MGLPDLGHGIGLRRDHWQTLFEPGAAQGIDFLEILSENFMRRGGRNARILAQAAEAFPLVLHGTALSIGSIDPLDEDYLDALHDLATRTRPAWISDHLCFSSAFGVQYLDLIPLPFTEESLAHVAARIQTVQRRLGRPFLIENPSYYIEFAASTMTEAEYLTALCERADCGLLLDVNNIWVNARNHRYDPQAFIDALPAHRIVQIHLAGHEDMGDVIIDTHGAPVIDPVLDLYAYTLRRTGPVATLIEWDNNIPPLAELRAENDKARAVARVALRGVMPDATGGATPNAMLGATPDATPDAIPAATPKRPR